MHDPDTIYMYTLCADIYRATNIFHSIAIGWDAKGPHLHCNRIAYTCTYHSKKGIVILISGLLFEFQMSDLTQRS